MIWFLMILMLSQSVNAQGHGEQASPDFAPTPESRAPITKEEASELFANKSESFVQGFMEGCVNMAAIWMANYKQREINKYELNAVNDTCQAMFYTIHQPKYKKPDFETSTDQSLPTN